MAAFCVSLVVLSPTLPEQGNMQVAFMVVHPNLKSFTLSGTI